MSRSVTCQISGLSGHRMLNYGRSVSADHVSNYKFMVLLQLFVIKDRLLDTLDAKISPEMICDTTDQVYQSIVT